MNRIDLKLKASGGAGDLISANSFLKITTANPDNNPRVALWVVPSPNALASSDPLVVRFNKFGDEGIDAGDYYVVYADEQTPAVSNGTAFPSFSTASSGLVANQNYFENSFFNGAVAGVPDANAYLYSTTPNLGSLTMYDNFFDVTPPNFLLAFLSSITGSVAQNTLQSQDLFVGNVNESITFFLTRIPHVSNAGTLGTLIDPLGQYLNQ